MYFNIFGICFYYIVLIGENMINKILNKFKMTFQSLKINIKKLKKEIKALYLASKRRDVPWYAKLVILLVPSDIMNECREQSENIFKEGKPKNWIAGSIIIFIWVVFLTYILIKLFKYLLNNHNLSIS